MQRYVFVTDDKQEALKAAEAARYIRRVAMSMRNNVARLDGAFLQEMPAPDEPPLEEIASRLIVGDAETCAEKLTAEIDANCSRCMSVASWDCRTCRRIATLRSMEMFGTEVMPRIRSCRRRVRAHWPRSRSVDARTVPTVDTGARLRAARRGAVPVSGGVLRLAAGARGAAQRDGAASRDRQLHEDPVRRPLSADPDLHAGGRGDRHRGLAVDRLSGCRADGAHAGAQVAIDDGVDRRVAVDQRGDPQLRVDDPVPALWHRE